VQRPTRDELIALAKADPEAIADLVLMLWDRVEALEKRIAELERNSRTSSKPPSTDKGNFTNQPKPKPKSLRQKTKRKTGGQQPPFSPIRSGPKAASKPSRQKQFPSSQPPFSPIRSGPKAASKPSRQKQFPSSVSSG